MAQKDKHLHLIFNFCPTLMSKKKCFGLYYRLADNSIKTLIQIDNSKKHTQKEIINTLYHELTHFIIDLMFDKDNFEKYLYPLDSYKCKRSKTSDLTLTKIPLL